jgi:hypothetical protein
MNVKGESAVLLAKRRILVRLGDQRFLGLDGATAAIMVPAAVICLNV